MTVLWILSLLAGGLTAIDQLRRPASQWVAADRDRSFWVTMTVLGGLLYLGIVAAIVYAVTLLPLLGRAPGGDFAHAPAPVAPLAPVAPEPPPAPARPATGKLVIDLDDV